MPTISNATVATGTGLSTAGNGGRKMVRLANGNLYSVIKNGNNFVIYKSVNGGSTWSQHYTNGGNTSLQDVTLASKGNDLYLLWTLNNTTVSAFVFINESATPLATTLDSSQTALGNISLAINEAGTELHAAWSSKNATYPNSFNIRYAKGTINGDGSVTWGAVEQVTTDNFSSSFPNFAINPAVVMVNNMPHIYVQQADRVPVGTSIGQGGAITLLKKDNSLTTGNSILATGWSYKVVYNAGNATYTQSNPSSLFVPQSINGLANGRLWVAWHGKDATDSAKFNVRVSYSDDGGVTWATPVKLTSGNLYDRQNVTLAADKTGKVFALYEEHQWSPDLDIYMRTFSGGSWGAPVAVAEVDPAAESNPSALVDYSLVMTTPPFVFMSGTDGIKFSGNFNVGASVSPASGALGNKETATLTSYTVTPEAGSTVTQIVEKINGVTVNTFNNPASLSRTLTVPNATWDTLAYFATHTASITVTDSNGATTVTTYSFDKTLGNGASLLEAEKANRDAKNRVAQKKDVLAAQVGLSAGSTFDAISAQLASGTVLKKFATGTVTSVPANGSAVINTLTFKPSIVVFKYNSSRYSGSTYGATAQVFGEMSPVEILQQPTGLTAKNFTSNGFALINTDGAYANNSISWTALG